MTHPGREILPGFFVKGVGMWEIERTEHCVGPFRFVIMGDSKQEILKKLTVRCEYKGEGISDTFNATKGLEGNLIALMRQNCGMERPWFDNQGNDWARLLSCSTRENLCQRMAEEIGRHWLYEATGYELQHLTGAGYLSIQEWFLEHIAKGV